MKVFNRPAVSKKEGTGVLTLSCLAGIIILIITLHGCSSSEIIAQPLSPETQASLAEPPITTPEKNTTPFTPTTAATIDVSRPVIHPKVEEEIRAKQHHELVRVLVEAEDDDALEELSEAVESAGGTVKQSFSIGDVAVIELPAEKIPEIAQQTGVQEIAPEKEYIALLQDRIPAFSIDTAWANNITGSGTTIAILDTGIGPHNSINVALAKSFVAGEDSSDQNGHGTHVAGIAQGIAPSARLLNAKVLSKSGSGTTSQIIAGINWATDPDGNPSTDDGANIISMSFGGMFTDIDGPLASAVKEAISRGVVFVAAAGNCRQGCGGFFGVVTPANLQDVIAVGAVDDNNIVASFSSGDKFDNYIKPDITAPGVDITSAWLNNGQKTLSGTSMSAPFVAGTIALLLQKEPLLNNTEIKNRLETAAEDLGEPGKDTSYGAGIINTPRLLETQTIIQPEETNNETNITQIRNSTTTFTKYVTIYENENEGKYVYTNDEEETLILTYNITPRINIENISQQMLLNYYHAPSSRADVTVELFSQIPANKNPTYLKLMIESYKTTTYFDYKIISLPNTVINALIEGKYITLTTSFTTPPNYGKYNAFIVILDNNQNAIIPYVRDYADPTGKIFEVVNLTGPGQCSKDQDCEADKYVDTPYCSDGDVWQQYKDNYCRNPGTPNSVCTFELYPKKKQECNTAMCVNGECITTTQCTITSTILSHYPTIIEGQTLSVKVEGNEDTCNGQQVTFEIWEDDDLNSDDFIYSFSNQFEGKTTTGAWIVSWTEDELGGPEYYYKIIGPKNTMTTLTVSVKKACNNNELCEIERGETHTNCPNDCKKPDGDSCTANSDCQSRFCWNNICSQPCTDNDKDGYGTSGSGCKAGDILRDCNDDNAAIHPGATEVCDGVDNNCDGSINEGNVCCGNGACDYGETDTTCSKDCWGKLRVISVTAPTTVDQGQTVTVQAQIQNQGTYVDNLYVEAGIAPDYWGLYGYFMQGYDPQVSWDTQKCCVGNDYYAAKLISLNAGQTETLTFTLKAPSVNTIDSCGTVADRKSAWDSSHTLVVGLYERCAGGYWHKLLADIKVRDRPCTKQSDCPTQTYCAFSGTSGTCQPSFCTNQCTAGKYSCNGQTIRYCADTNNDNCVEWDDIKTCGTGYSCIPGQSTCQDTQIDTLLTLEEAGTTPVLAQTGDIVSVKLDHKTTETITLEYDSNAFTLDTNSCPGSTFTITRDMICNFTVKGTSGEYTFKLKYGTGSGNVRIISYPSGIIITNKPKLYQRFSNAEEVTKLLRKTYEYAEKNNLVLYDVSRYVSTPNPWKQFSDYREGPFNPLLTNNDHALDIGNLIREKCNKNGCKNTIILGDDFVVPHYRRNISLLNWYYFLPFLPDSKTNTAFTEIGYIQRKTKTFAEFDKIFYRNEYDKTYEGKDIILIIPDSLAPEQRNEINFLKQVLDEKGYKPDFKEKKSSEIYCNDLQLWDNLNGATLFVFGSENTNNAYNCFPFQAGFENHNAAFIEINPWDSNNYAVIVNTDDAQVIHAFTKLIEDNGYKNLASESAYFFRVGVQTAGYVVLGVSAAALIVGTGGTAAPAILATGWAITEAAIDAADAVDTCIVNPEGIGWCATATAFAIIPGVNSGTKNAIKKLADDNVVKALKPFENLFKKHRKKLQNLFGDTLKRVIKNTDDEIALVKGTETIVKEGNEAEDAIKKWIRKFGFGNTEEGTVHALNTIKKIGKYDDEFFESNKLTRYSETNKRIFRADNRNPDDIFNKDAPGFKAKGTSPDYKEYVAKNDPNSRYIGASETVEGASHAAISSRNIEGGEGGSWIYVLDPRARNFVDDLKTLPNPSRDRLIERGVIAIDEIDANDVVGAVYVKVYSDKELLINKGIIDIKNIEIINDLTIINPKYKGNLNLANINVLEGD